MNLNEIKKPVAAHLKEFDKVFKKAVKSNVPLLNIVMQYIIKSKGKQMRPVIVLYSAELFDNINESTYRGATLVELLHTATLVHDDVVDDSYQRRGKFSINAIWRNKIAVLAGDFLLSRGLLTALESKDYNLLEIASRAVKDMSEGELLQIEKARKLDISEEVYYEIIRQKTASLLASCFAIGAASAGVDKTTTELMRQIGENLGMAFQIKDDLLDFGDSSQTGKPTGIDIKEKKMTLPIIYLLNNSNKSGKKKIINTIKKHNNDKAKVNELIETVRKSGGIDYAREKMDEFKNNALELLSKMPDNEARAMLIELVNFTIDRKK